LAATLCAFETISHSVALISPMVIASPVNWVDHLDGQIAKA
jgi:hypothetical protein